MSSKGRIEELVSRWRKPLALIAVVSLSLYFGPSAATFDLTLLFGTVALVVSLVLLARPTWLAYVLTFLLPLYWLPGVGQRFSLLKLVALAGVPLILMISLIRRKRILIVDRVLVAAVAFVAFLAFYLFFAGDLDYWSLRDYVLNPTVIFVLIPLLVASLVRSVPEVRSLKTLLIAIGVGESVLAMVQMLTGGLLIMQDLPGYAETSSGVYREIYAAGFAAQAVSGVGTFHQRGELGLFLFLPFTFALVDVLSGVERRTPARVAVLLLLTAGILVSFARVWIILAALAGVVLVFRLSKGPALTRIVNSSVLVGVVVLGVVLLMLVPTPLSEGLAFRFQLADTSASDSPLRSFYGYRPELWQTAWRMFESSPFVGLGPRAFATYRFDFGLQRGLAEDHVANGYLDLLVQVGILGGVLALVFLVLLGLNHRRPKGGSAMTAEIEALRLVSLTYFLGNAANFMVAGNFITGEYPFAFSIALAIICRRLLRPQGESQPALAALGSNQHSAFSRQGAVEPQGRRERG